MTKYTWEAPIPLSVNYETVPFPMNVFPKWCSDYIKEVSRMVGLSPELAANLLIALVAGLVAKNFKVAYHEDYIVPLNLWTVTLLDAGAGKTPVLKKIMEPFDGTEIKDMIYDDVALERLPVFLDKHDENGIIMSAEMAFFYNIFNTNADVSLLLSSFDGEQKRIERKNCSMILREPKTSIGLTFQPRVLEKVKHYKRFSLMKDNGFFDRFLFSLPDRQEAEVGSQAPINYEVKQQYKEKMLRLSEIKEFDGLIEFHLTDLQREAITRFERRQLPLLQEDGKYSSIESFCRKAKGKILRLAGILHVLHLTECNGSLLGEQEAKCDPMTISDDNIEDAIELVAYYREQMLKVFGEIDDSHLEPARKLLNRIIRNQKVSFTRRDIQQQVRCTHGLKTPDELDAALSILEAYGYIRSYENLQQQRGKRSVSIEVHPDFIDHPMLRAV